MHENSLTFTTKKTNFHKIEIAKDFVIQNTVINIPNIYSKALAYFDPGTGSYIIQLILAFLASCYFFITNPIKFIKEYLNKFKRKKKIDKKDQE